jgi:hypothetical protein
LSVASSTQTVKDNAGAFYPHLVQVFEILLDIAKGREVEFDHVFTRLTNEVMMLAGQHWIETILAAGFIKPPGADQAFLLEPAQGAVHSGEIQAGILLHCDGM